MTLQNESWHLSKSVPLSIILGFIIQTSAAVWWASAISNEVTNIKEDVKQAQEIHAAKNDVKMMLELRDERISNIHTMLDKIDKKLDKLIIQ